VFVEKPAIVQGDRTVLLEVEHAGYEAGRDILSRFAELERSPEHVHTYRLSTLALWNAAALGITTAEVLDGLRAISRFELPANVEHEIRDLMGRHGVCRLVDGADPSELELRVTSEAVRLRLTRDRKLAELIAPRGEHFAVPIAHRGALKRGLLGAGYPVDDVAGLVDGAPLDVPVKLDTFTPYPYQTAAVAAFRVTGHGVIVLPCGAGKTVIGVLAMAALGTRTLVLTSSREAATQWRRELRARTQLADDAVRVYEGARGATVANCTRPLPRSVPVPAPAASSACCRSRADTPRRKPTISLPGITTDACGAGATAACRTPAVARPPAPDTTTASTTTEAATRRPRAMLPRYMCNIGVAILTWGIIRGHSIG
jgi:hypothetical protein